MTDELDQIVHMAAVESWQKFKERIICGDTFAKEIEPVIRQACEFAAQSAVELHIANEKLKSNWKEGDMSCLEAKSLDSSTKGSGEPDSSSLPVAESLPNSPGTPPCCKGVESVKWNPYNGVVQCHACGTIYDARPAPKGGKV